MIEIDVSPDTSVVAKVLYASRFFRDLVLLGVYLDGYVADRQPDLLVYTSGKCIGSGGWREVGNEEVSAAERNLSLRIVGGEVWQGDEVLRAASEDDWKKLSNMAASGCAAAETKIRMALAAKRGR